MKIFTHLSPIILLFSFFISFSAKAENSLKPFFTDGCTLFVDGTPSKPGLWRPCCVEHDLRYWVGGSTDDMDRTDLKLKSCVQKIAGEHWARTIYTGVRAGHYSPIKNKTAWSWGWTNRREKVALNSQEISIVITELKKLKLDSEKVSMDEFIKNNFP